MSPRQPARSDLVPIGEAAERFGIAASALRFYEERGLVAPAARAGGRRWYGPAELRRIAFIRTAQHLGMNLDDIQALLDADGTGWRRLVTTYIDRLHRQRAWIETTLTALHSTMACRSDHPLVDCPHLAAVLDDRIDSGFFDSGGDADQNRGARRSPGGEDEHGRGGPTAPVQ